MIAFLALLLAAEGRPLFYWGAHAPAIAVEAAKSETTEAQLTEVYAALDGSSLLIKFTYDRPVRTALYLPSGAPVSGRLRAVLYLDGDDDRRTGLDQGASDARTGADRRLEIGVVSVGEDKAEHRLATALVTASLASLAPDGRRRMLWRRDNAAAPREVSVHGDSVELRLPLDRAEVQPGSRLILAVGDRVYQGKLE